ncbi:activation-dependent, raft-recruited ADAP-like phosphoprotein isoform X2 [Numida meleagris]|uniref:activation-dependent, raft-recruited ADAP-like phosphoprotein isoform X2 n=1 Tax=Numida meleagris TaxID=8996 RepID=UPI000B3D8FB0|nr:activation-dependent, raft-recruited ADAP-like phosphoprotein isoform X2 [Numida meleagris]
MTVLGSGAMDVEGVTDFRALRAKFQHDSSLATKPVQPRQKPSPRLGSGGSSAPSPVPTSKTDVQAPRPRSEPPCLTSQPSAVVQRAKMGRTEPMECNEERKGNVSVKGLSSPKNSSPKHPVSYCTEQQAPTQADPEDAPLLNSFHHALQMWKNTLSGGEKANTEPPARRVMNLYVQPSPEQRVLRAPAASNGSKEPPVGSHPAPTQPTQGLASAQGNGRAAGSSVATALQPQHQKEPKPPLCQPRAETQLDSPSSKPPKIRPLPSTASLGPAPQKPSRPPKVDLSAFRTTVPSVYRQNQTTAEEEDYLIPESTQLEEQHNYKKTLTYLNQSGDTTTLCVIEVPKVEPQEHKKQKSFLFGESSPGRAIIEDEKEGKTSLEREKQEVKKPGGNEYVTLNGQTREDDRGGMKVSHMRQDVTSTPQKLAKDRAVPLYYGAPKPTEDRATSSPNHRQLLLTPEDVYDDVEGLQDRLHASDALSPSVSDNISGSNYEETYDDVGTGSDNPAKEEAEKQKRFGKLFKIEKLKLKNTRFKENLRLFSMSVPNLADVSQEDMVYDDVETEQKDPREKDDRYKTWMPKFLMAKEAKDRRRSSDDVERSIFKVKKSNAEKNKMEKEEKIFRETFLYDKKISVINTATAACSIPSKRRADLPLTAGEQLDVIDVTEGSAVICRNSEGRYGYVLVEHLNFRQY